MTHASRGSLKCIPLLVSESSYRLRKLSDNKKVYAESPCLVLSVNFKGFYYKHNTSEMRLLDFRTRPLRNTKHSLCLVGKQQVVIVCVPSAQAWPGPHMLVTVEQAEKKYPTYYFILAIRS